ncbi:hypothetical protein KSX_66370 [Ktedonospora formicarum]|uniref:Uncharacterized protein n=2 Tax=Ktedonospora formicarum TaxID=2778364 RepID=A0A8J3IBS7_9CHLR|nr:hypothetical protein KSX_66370 [Ktedonospora formicarum]
MTHQSERQTDAMTWQPVAKEQKTPGELLPKSHASGNMLEDVTKTSGSPLRQHLAEIGAVLRDLSPAHLRELAQDCSQRFSQSNEKAGVYLKRLHEQPEILHLAAVDALVRTWFPDPGHEPTRLNAGWVLSRYRAYSEQGEEPPADIFAWARWVIEFGFNYEALEMVLEAAACQQNAEVRGYVRPLPHELVLNGACLDALRRQRFWNKGAGAGMLAHGLVFVDLDGALFTPQEYEQYRRQVLEYALAGRPGEEPLDDGEMHAYLAWLALHPEARESPEVSLSRLSPPLFHLASQLAEQIDHQRFKLCASQHPGTGEEVIQVIERHSPDNDWLLWTQDHVSLWLEAYQAQESEKENHFNGHNVTSTSNNAHNAAGEMSQTNTPTHTRRGAI